MKKERWKNLDKKSIRNLLASRIEEIDALSIPHFSLLSDIQKATDRIVKAIKNGEKIVVVGDYDVDGVSSSAIMTLFFEDVGYPIEIVIPNRFEDGYGLTPKLLKKIDADLIITVDNGITSFEAAQICRERGVDLIITDHHTPKRMESSQVPSSEFQVLSSNNSQFLLPDAYAIVNPKTSPDFPFKEICGAEVAWYLCGSIKQALKLDIDLRRFLDILSIAIIADVMPLTHMNRKLVQMGLKILNRARKPFSKILKQQFNKEFKSDDIAFQIAPRLNAAGRMDSAYTAYKFLISKSEDEAFRLFLELDRLNSLRKETEKEIVENLEEVGDDFLVVSGDFHEGVIGIVASRLMHKYKRPAIVFSEENGVLKGSGRSLGNVDIFKLVSECEEFIEGFGGHKMACGLTIKRENLENLKEKLNNLIKEYKSEDFFIEDFILGELPFSEIDFELFEILKEFEPYGEGNPSPKFVANAKVEKVQHLKDNHYKLFLSQNETLIPALLFRWDNEIPDEISFKFSITQNSFYNNLELIIEEIF